MAGWSYPFLDALSRGGSRPRYLFESIGGVAYVPGSSSIWLSTHDEGSFYLPIIARAGHSYRAGTLQPGEWSSTQSELSLRLTRGWSYSEPASHGLSASARGQLCVLRMGFGGWNRNDYQTIFTGRIVGIRKGDAGDWFVDLRSALGLVVSRASQLDEESSLFWELPQDATTLTSNVTSGSTSLTVASATGADAETGEKSLIEVTPDDTDTDPYFLVGTWSGTTFNIDSVAFGATQDTAGNGNDVRLLAYVHDHPVDVVRKVIASTGSGDNGQWDTLPSSWGVGLPWSVLHDDDCDATKHVINSGSNAVAASWRVFSADPQDDGLGWLSSLLSPAGLFLCEVEGQISVRAAVNSDGQQVESTTITDREIVSLDYDAYDPNAVAEYSRILVEGPTFQQNTVEYLASLPAALQRRMTLPYLDASEVAWVGNVGQRCKGWALRLPESISIVLAGLGRARLAPGSGLYIHSKRLDPRNTHDDAWFVTSCEPDWFGVTTRITASRIPHSEDAP